MKMKGKIKDEIQAKRQVETNEDTYENNENTKRVNFFGSDIASFD